MDLIEKLSELSPRRFPNDQFTCSVLFPLPDASRRMRGEHVCSTLALHAVGRGVMDASTQQGKAARATPEGHRPRRRPCPRCRRCHRRPCPSAPTRPRGRRPLKKGRKWVLRRIGGSATLAAQDIGTLVACSWPVRLYSERRTPNRTKNTQGRSRCSPWGHPNPQNRRSP